MSLAATKVQNVRAKNPELDKNEHRLSEYGALDFFVQQSMSNPLLTRETKEQAIKGAGKVIETPAIKYDGSVTVATSRTCTIADDENESVLVPYTWKTYQVGFTMVPAQYSNNDIDYEKDFTAKLKKVARALGAKMDEDAIAQLEANKTQVYADTLLYGNTANVLQVPFASREEILSDVEPMMEANDFYEGIHIIGNAGIKSLLNKLDEKGTFQAVDKTLEYANKKFHFSNRLANEEGKYATFYAVEDGNVDMLFRYDREAVRGSSANGHEWDIVNMPYLDIPVGLHYYTEVGDQSAIAGTATADLVCGIKEFYGFSVDVAYVVAYNSSLSTRANPIMKAEIASGATYAQPVYVANTEADPVHTKAVGAGA